MDWREVRTQDPLVHLAVHVQLLQGFDLFLFLLLLYLDLVLGLQLMAKQPIC